MRWRSTGLVLLLAVALPAAAKDDMQALTNGELCVRHDISLILGESLDGNTEGEQAAELVRRNEACEPSSFYLQIANKRVQDMQEVLHARAELQQEQDANQRTWGDRLRDASNAYLRMQEQQRQQRPVQTTCRNTIVGVDCTTWQ
jgi:hypothetical protein